MPVNLSKTEFESLRKKDIKLDALDVNLLNEFGEPIEDVRYTWNLK